MDEFILMKEDHDSFIHVNIGDSIKILLTENANTGYTWDMEGEVPKELKMIFNDYKLTHKKTLGGSGKRVVEFIAKELGEVSIKLKYWQEWNGDDSIDDRFAVTILVEDEDED
ncbi:protease inhibitor I42 family protein [Polaribacter sp.]|uniref:protease inhibitor I42 family protein n=1 Tax=Polaribacter sp. TaxID=1920175 RepID=UPI003EF606E5